MRKFLLLAVLAGLSWWYFIGGRTITEGHVVRFYQELERATLSRNPEALCAMLDEDFEAVGTVEIGGQNVESTQNKTETCEGYADLYQSFALMGDSMGGMVQLDSRWEIKSVEIEPDGKSATVDYYSALDVAGSIMNIRSRSTDTLIRRNGKVLMLYSEGTGSIRAGG